jgi:hypothetical protein
LKSGFFMWGENNEGWIRSSRRFNPGNRFLKRPRSRPYPINGEDPNSPLLPLHFLSPDPVEDLRAYVADYLKEEVVAEALTQNIPAFREFLQTGRSKNALSFVWKNSPAG